MIKKNRDNFRELFNKFMDAVFIIDAATGIIIDCNCAAGELVGRKKTELIGEHENILYPSEKRHERFIRKLREHLKVEDGISLCTWVVTKEGDRKDVSMRAGSVEVNGKKVMQVLFRDVTDLKKSEIILQESDITERKLKEEILYQTRKDWDDTFNSINDFITIHDINFNILNANTSARKLLKLPDLTEDKAKCYNHYHGKNRPPEGCPVRTCLKTGKVETFELFESHLGKYIEIRALPRFDNKKQITGFVHIVRDIGRLKKGEEQLESSRRDSRNLAEHLLDVREEERINIARDIHDELAQILTTLNMDLLSLDKKLRRNQKSLSNEIKSMSKLSRTAIHAVQRVSLDLRPGLLYDLGLQAAIKCYSRNMGKKSGISFALDLDSKESKLDQKLAITVFRIFQEALTNVVRHSNATWVKVRSKQSAGNLVMEERDNGTGITRRQISDPQSLGIAGMQERVNILGGKIKISGTRNRGTTVSAIIPLGK
jgi:PAS domain S-box-containing protein